MHGARVLANSDFYCRGLDHANRSPWTRPALQPSISDEAVDTEKSHDLKFYKGAISIVYFHTGSYRKDG